MFRFVSGQMPPSALVYIEIKGLEEALVLVVGSMIAGLPSMVFMFDLLVTSECPTYGGLR
jgi:hypothetical protein